MKITDTPQQKNDGGTMQSITIHAILLGVNSILRSQADCGAGCWGMGLSDKAHNSWNRVLSLFQASLM